MYNQFFCVRYETDECFLFSLSDFPELKRNRYEFISNKGQKLVGYHYYSSKDNIIGADPEIPIPGFLIVNVKKHINSFSELNKEARIEIGNVIAYAEKALKELKIVQEERSKHLHIWIFPNFKWMTEKFGKGITYLREISEYAQKNSNEDNIKKCLNVVEKIKQYFKEHDINN